MTTMVNYGLMVLLFLAWVGLFAVKETSREAGMQVRALELEIEDERSAIRYLMTDWAILNEPSYLQSLARTHLALNSMAPQQIVTMTALPPVPLHNGAPANAGTLYASAPMGSSYYTNRVGAFMQDRAPSGAPETVNASIASWVRPVLRPANGG